MNQRTIDRFWSRVKKSDGCWIWTGSKRNKGYGAFVWADDAGNVIQGRAHRFSYELVNGPIPPKMFVLHHCDNPACVRPDHLFLGTNQDNVSDMMAKGRHVAGGTYGPGNYERGETHHNARLTAEIVREIRNAARSGEGYASICSRFGLCHSHASKIINRGAWKHVE